MSWVLITQQGVADGQFSVPTPEELEALPSHAERAQANAAWRALAPEVRRTTVICPLEVLLKTAKKRHGVPREVTAADLRVEELMNERGCTRVWARELARREARGQELPPQDTGNDPLTVRARQIQAEKNCKWGWARELARREQKTGSTSESSAASTETAPDTTP